tara:strand:+ start:2896 stop:3060 length:165 start_codon:yes stop_codon:yes gene_type:complete
MTKTDITSILTELAVLQQQMRSTEARVKRLELLVIWAFGIYTTATLGVIFSGVL